MKTKIIFGLLIFLLVVFISLLFVPEKKSFKVITSPKIFSLLKSSENENIKIQLLVNRNDSYYFDQEYISSISLNSELDEEIISLIIEEITYSNNLYEYENDNYYLVELSLSINFNSEDYLIALEKAYLNILYNNEEDLKVYIGEFNYRFKDDLNDELSLSNLSSTVTEINSTNTVSGIYIELYNRSEENLVITNFLLGSSSITFNDYYLSEIYNEPDLFDSVEEILLIENYNFKSFDNILEKSILIRENQSIMLYVPLSYIGEIDYIHRFYFEVNYLNNEGETSLIIDDIPYISTSIFQTELESGYIVYEIPN